MIVRLIFALLVLVPSPAWAQSLAGSWALRAEGAVIFRFDLEREGDGWNGRWTRPESFASDGERFGSLEGSETLEASEARAIGDWAELTFADDRPGAVPDVFRFHLLGPDRAEMIYVGTGLPPYTLERVAEDALLGPWQPGEVYSRAGAPAPRSRPPRPAAPPSEAEGPPLLPPLEGR